MDPLNVLHARLAAPPRSGGVDVLCRDWIEHRARVICKLPHPVENGLWLVHALRGAIGSVLYVMPPRASGDPLPRDIFLSPGPFIDDRRRVPVPFLIEARARGRKVTVDLRVFGFARRWRDTLHLAALSALRSGVRVNEGSAMRRPWDLLSFAWSEVEGMPAPWQTTPSGPVVTILPETALSYGSGDHDPSRPDTFIASAASRVAGMARWCGLNLSVDLDAIADRASRLTIHAEGDRPADILRKRSRRHPGVLLHHHGETTPLKVLGADDEIRSFLALAQAIGAGGRTSFGFGRYRLL